MTDWYRWRDTLRRTGTRSAARRCSHVGNHRLPKGVRRKPMTRPEQATASARGRRHRLWRQAERGPGHPDERADVPFGAELLRHAGVPQRLHNRARTALRSRDRLAQLIERHRITIAHGADDVRPLMRLPDEIKRRYDLSSLRFIVHGAAPCPPQVKRAMTSGGAGHQRVFSARRNGIPVGIRRGGLANPARRPRDRGTVSSRYSAPTANCVPSRAGEIFMRQSRRCGIRLSRQGRGARRSRPHGLVSVGDSRLSRRRRLPVPVRRKRDRGSPAASKSIPHEIENALIGMDGVRELRGVRRSRRRIRRAAVRLLSSRKLSRAVTGRRAGVLRGRLANFKVPRTSSSWNDARKPRQDFQRKLRDLYTEGRLRAIG